MIDIVNENQKQYQIIRDESPQEKIYIMQPITEDNEADEHPLTEEAKSLIESAGAAVAGVAVQKLRNISPATVFGSVNPLSGL